MTSCLRSEPDSHRHRRQISCRYQHLSAQGGLCVRPDRAVRYNQDLQGRRDALDERGHVCRFIEPGNDDGQRQC
jgi:hypothetical protein